METFNLTAALSAVLFPADHPAGLCAHGSACSQAVAPFNVPGLGVRYFITAFHPNFNSKSNNGTGYKTRNAALRAIRARESR